MNSFCKLLLSLVLGLGLFTTLATSPVLAGTGSGAVTASAHRTYYYLYYRTSPHSQWICLGWTTNYTAVQQAANYVRQLGYDAYIYTYRS